MNYIYLDRSKQLQIGKEKSSNISIQVECTKEQFEILLDNPEEIHKRYFIDVDQLIKTNVKYALSGLKDTDKDEGMTDINLHNMED